MKTAIAIIFATSSLCGCTTLRWAVGGIPTMLEWSVGGLIAGSSEPQLTMCSQHPCENA